MDLQSPETEASILRALKWSCGGAAIFGHPKLLELLAATFWESRHGYRRMDVNQWLILQKSPVSQPGAGKKWP